MFKALLILWSLLGLVLFVWTTGDRSINDEKITGRALLRFIAICGPLVWGSVLVVVLCYRLLPMSVITRIEEIMDRILEGGE